MEYQGTPHVASEDSDVWTWIMLAILIVLGVVIGVGGLALTSWNSQNQMATGSQSVPSSK